MHAVNRLIRLFFNFFKSLFYGTFMLSLKETYNGTLYKTVGTMYLQHTTPYKPIHQKVPTRQQELLQVLGLSTATTCCAVFRARLKRSSATTEIRN